jgi:(E)-4-hydroxy-3-methylbut-2-enyl-diphosphate synthase
MRKRRATRAVKAGTLVIGGGFPVSIQTMWKERLTRRSLPAVRRTLDILAGYGCDFVRFAVPDIESAGLLGELAGSTRTQLIADVHFDYRIALACLDYPLAKVRINPGNIGEDWKVREVIAKAKDSGISLRIGVNAGSLPLRLRPLKNQALALVKAAESEMEALERLRFFSAVFSLKSSDIGTTIRANVIFSRKYDYPLHIGMTEAGPAIPGIVRNTVGIRSLLEKGIGDTVRVSLSASAEEEVLSAVEILRTANVRDSGVRLISCPRCGRASFDVHAFLELVSFKIHTIKKPLVVAVMGCAVNGPGEARHADIGIAGAGKMAIIFRAGEVVRRTSFQEAAKAFLEEIDKLCAQS